MSFTLSSSKLKIAFQDAAELLTSFGSQITYTFHNGTAAISIAARRVELREDELIGDFQQGDCRFLINASDMPQAPEKYDSITDDRGVTYTLVDYISCSRGIDGTVVLYTPVARG